MLYRIHFLSKSFFLMSVFIFSCNPVPTSYKILTINRSKSARTSETIEIALSDVPNFFKSNYDNLVVMNRNGEELLVQHLDIDQDSIYDHIIFQTYFEPNESKEFTLTTRKKIPREEPKQYTFCRIVPERMDDFAWENDKVAFRTYGPECQRLYEEEIPGGLISSGIDVWTKRVDYPIINKWYKDDKNGKSYHQDHGEGLDAYHVGTTRGCGGTAILQNEDFILSKNFISWKILTNGPIRSVFELEYAPIEVGGQSVGEKKRITLNLGSNLYHCKVFYDSKEPLNSAAIGLALHEGKGTVNQNMEKGWVTHWEAYDDSELGTAIVLDPEILEAIQINDTLAKDERFNNIWAITNVKQNTFSYWAGFGWKKSGHFNSQEEWKKYVKKEALKKNIPIQIKITKG